MAREISIEAFEGPLDLLLHLVAQHRIDIYDIPIARIAEQYLSYIYEWQEMNLEIAGEFVVMAARLLEIKSYMLLPTVAEDPETGEALKQQLIQQLVEYQVYKSVAAYLKEREAENIGAVYKEPEYYPEMDKPQFIEIDGDLLADTFNTVLAMQREEEQMRPAAAEITRDLFTVEDKISLLRQILSEKMEMCFSELMIHSGGIPEVVTAFQAMLEYYKSGTIRLLQRGLFGEIIIKHISND